MCIRAPASLMDPPPAVGLRRGLGAEMAALDPAELAKSTVEERGWELKRLLHGFEQNRVSFAAVADVCAGALALAAAGGPPCAKTLANSLVARSKCGFSSSCGRCGRATSSLCSGCMIAAYCSTECLAQDWEHHSKACLAGCPNSLDKYLAAHMHYLAANNPCLQAEHLFVMHRAFATIAENHLDVFKACLKLPAHRQAARRVLELGEYSPKLVYWVLMMSKTPVVIDVSA